MANFAILRTRKLKTPGNVAASLRHAFREKETPNADMTRTSGNVHLGADSVEQAMGQFRARLPDKVRKNAVHAIEYLVTASPDAIARMTQQQQADYFNGALKWLRERHGAKNVFYAGMHFDETTPHLYAYVVPLDAKNKLNCRAFLGGPAVLSAMQTEFADKVGRPVGLDRGLKGSKAKHKTISQYYASLGALDERIRPPKRHFGESEEKYQERYKEQLAPLLRASLDTKQVKARNEELEGYFIKAKQDSLAFKERLSGLTDEQQHQIAAVAAQWRRENEQERKSRTKGRSGPGLSR